MIYIRHRSAAAGANAGIFDFDPARRVLDVVLRTGFEVEPIWVCTAERPRFGAHVLVRIDATTWRVSSAAFLYPDLRRAPKAHAHHIDLPVCELILTHVPPHIARELESL